MRKSLLLATAATAILVALPSTLSYAQQGQTSVLPAGQGLNITNPAGYTKPDAKRAETAVIADTATIADNATYADNAGKLGGKTAANLRVGSAASADTAAMADSATTAGSATTADSATTAGKATNADFATSSGTATSATTATTASTAINANNLRSMDGASYLSASDLKVGAALSADSADTASTAALATRAKGLASGATIDGSMITGTVAKAASADSATNADRLLHTDGVSYMMAKDLAVGAANWASNATNAAKVLYDGRYIDASQVTVSRSVSSTYSDHSTETGAKCGSRPHGAVWSEGGHFYQCMAGSEFRLN